MSNMRRTYGEYTADIRRIYGEWSADIRRTYGGHTADIRQKLPRTYSEHTANIRRIYANIIYQFPIKIQQTVHPLDVRQNLGFSNHPPPPPLVRVCLNFQNHPPTPSPDVRVRIFQFYTFFNFYTFLFLLIKTKFIAQFLFL